MSDWIEAEQRAERAQQLLESECWPEALDELTAAIEINPHNAEWHGNRGYLLDQMSRHEDARGAYRLAVELDADNCEWLTALGLDLTRLGELDEAVELFERIARLDPSNELAFCQRTAIYAYLNEHEKAEEMFYLAQQLKSDCPHCFYHLGTSLAARELWDRAMYCWSRVLEISPTYHGANHRLADASRTRGNPDKAREFYLAELRLDPGNVDVLEAMAHMMFETGQPIEQSRMKFLQILELDPQHTGARLGLARVALAEGRSETAIPTLTEILAAEPTNATAHRLMGQHLIRRKHYADARSHLTKALATDPNDRIALAAMGSCLAKLECPRLAATYFERLLTLEPEAHGARHNLAVCYFAQDRLEEGCRECMKILEKDERHVPAMQKLALAYTRLGRLKEARTLGRQALACEPENRELQRLVRRLTWYRPVQLAARLATALTRPLGGRRRRAEPESA